MIPSLNAGIHVRAKAIWDSWEAERDEALQKLGGEENSSKLPDALRFAPLVPIVCDCCVKVISNFYRASSFLTWSTDPVTVDETKPGNWVLVGGTRYWACSTECARILFLIHHQYAMREHKSDPS